jgi:hypothetical protein
MQSVQNKSSEHQAQSQRQLSVKFLPPLLHSIGDYTAAAGLIIAPNILPLAQAGPAAYWISVAGGLLLIAYSLLTDYKLALAHVISFKNHLFLDTSAAVMFGLAPIALGFQGLAQAYYFALSLSLFVIVAISRES